MVALNALIDVMKYKLFVLLIVAICLLNVACAGPLLSVQSSENTGERSCSLPIAPSNMLSLVLSYKETMRYLTYAEDGCRFVFAEMLKKEVDSSLLMTKGCAKATLQDIEDALYHPEKLQERLNYLKEG